MVIMVLPDAMLRYWAEYQVTVDVCGGDVMHCLKSASVECEFTESALCGC